jgi:hypothetical protein
MKSGLLVAVGGPNLDTFTNILCALSRQVRSHLSIDKVLVLETTEGRQQYAELRERVRLALGRDAELRIRTVSNDLLQTIIPRVLVDGGREVGRDALIVDLTTGPKTVTAVLYACASFSQLEHLYYISVSKKGSSFVQLWAESEPEQYYKAVVLAPIKDVQELASQSFFDLVYYIEKLGKIDERAPARLAPEVRHATDQLRTALPLFFGNPPHFRSAMQAIGNAGEHIVGLILEVVKRIDPAGAPATATKLVDWSQKYRKDAKDGSVPPFALAIPGTHVLDTASRTLLNLRNAAAHGSPVQFSASEVRVAMSIALNLLETVLAVEATAPGP